MKIDWKVLIAAIIICNMAGIIGSFFTVSSVGSWYTTLNKPFFNPPSWVFGPVWTALYTMMGISLYIVWKKGIGKSEVKMAVSIFAVQLFLNTLWSIIFFGMRSPTLAFFEIIFLWVAIVFTIVKFYGVSKNAAYLLIPYILWVTFAAVLNFSIWMLNP